MDLLGIGYAVDHCIADHNARVERQNWEIYISDAAAALVNLRSKEGGFPRFWDIMHPKPEDSRTGEEIAEDIISRHGLKVVN